jgi:hypothetical protein
MSEGVHLNITARFVAHIGDGTPVALPAFLQRNGTALCRSNAVSDIPRPSKNDWQKKPHAFGRQQKSFEAFLFGEPDRLRLPRA